ncbi:MAG: FAD-dependent oxidoreductase [Polyangiaceae bacterium]
MTSSSVSGDSSHSRSKAGLDVIIVGRGLTALSIAYELSIRGKRVAVVGHRAATGDEPPTESWLSCAFDGCFTRLELRHGSEGARLAVESHAWAIDRVEHIVMSEGFDCGFTRLDRCFDVSASNGSGTLAHELAAAYRAGLRDAQLMTADRGDGALLRIPKQAYFHPRQYADALVRALGYMGAELSLDAHVDRIDGALVEAAPRDAAGERPMIFAFEGDRPIARAPVAIVTTHGFLTLPDEGPSDVVARIGLVAGVPGIYVARPGSLNGATDGAIAGALLAELLDGRSHRWERLYDPMRRVPATIPRFDLGPPDVGAILGPPGELSSTADIAPGQGGVVRVGGIPFAVYRGPDGSLHEHTAVCTHLGGVVSWNAADKTFDCPCHGSRFDAMGRVLCGPACEDLAVLPVSKLDAPPDSHTRKTLTSAPDDDRPWDRAAQHLR